MIQPNELTITISRLPDNSAFTVEATGRNFAILSTIDQLLEEVKTAVIQHSAFLTISRKERIELLEQEIKDLKTLSPEPIKMENFAKHNLSDWIKNEYIKS